MTFLGKLSLSKKIAYDAPFLRYFNFFEHPTWSKVGELLSAEVASTSTFSILILKKYLHFTVLRFKSWYIMTWHQQFSVLEWMTRISNLHMSKILPNYSNGNEFNEMCLNISEFWLINQENLIMQKCLKLKFVIP